MHDPLDGATDRSRRRAPYGPPLRPEEIAAGSIEPTRYRPARLSDLRRMSGLIPAGMRINRRNWRQSLLTYAPFAVFLILNSAKGFTWGVIGLTASLVLVQVLQRVIGSQPLSPGVWVLTALVVMQGILGVAFDSKGAVFGATLLIPLLTGFVLLTSIISGRPLVALLVNRIWPLPPAVRRHPTMARTFYLLTLVAAACSLLQFVVLLWALLNLSANDFVLIQNAIGQIAILQLALLMILMTRVSRKASGIERGLIRAHAPSLLAGGAGWPVSGVILEASGIDAGYGPIQILYGASITVRQGERVALLGTNGAGKSTLLRVVAGILPMSSGVVWFKGRDITSLGPRQRVEQGLTYISGGHATFPGLTVVENLKVSTYGFRKDKAEVTARIDEALDLFPRLRERASQRVGTLSGGEQQMVAIGRALVSRPELLMIDELSLGLAPIVLQEIQQMITVLAERGMTMLIVEQSLNMAAAIAERAYFMERGEIRFEGQMSELLARGDLARSVFFGADLATPPDLVTAGAPSSDGAGRKPRARKAP